MVYNSRKSKTDLKQCVKCGADKNKDGLCSWKKCSLSKRKTSK